MSLSNLEEKVYFAALRAEGTVTFETIESWSICSHGTLKVVVHNLVKKEYFQRIKKGVYIAKKPDGSSLQDALLLAQNLFNGYLAFSSALYIHKLSEELPFTIFVATNSQSREKQFGNYIVKSAALGNRLLGTTKIEGYVTSTIPKTIYDCFHLPQYAGGYANILKAVFTAKMTEKQWKEFMQYVAKFEHFAFCQRVGYMLSLLKKETKINMPDFVLSYMKSKIKYNINLGEGKGLNIKDWKLEDSIGKEKLLSWWYHG